MDEPIELLTALQQKADKLNKELGWQRACRDIMRLLHKHKLYLPQPFIEEVCDYHDKGFPNDA